MASTAIARVKITASVSDEGRALVLAHAGERLVIQSEGLNGTFEVYVENDPDKVTFYAEPHQIQKTG